MTTPRSTTPEGGAASGGRGRFGLSSTGRGPGSGFGAVGAIAGVLLVALVVGGVVWSAASGNAPPSQRPHIFGGSLVLDDYRPLTVIDLATGEVTVQLEGVYAQVGATNYGDVEAVATSAGTTLVNRQTGAFNMLGSDDYVLGPSDNGISLGALTGARGAAGFADGDATYIVRYGPTSTVSLVNASTAEAGAAALAARPNHPVRPLGYDHLTSRLADLPGAAAVSGGDLWVLAGAGEKCQLVDLAPTPQHDQGLTATRRSSVPKACSAAALESSSGTVGLVMPGRVELFEPHGVIKDVGVPGTSKATGFLPVEGTDGELWYLARLPSGWSVFGALPDGRVTTPAALKAFGPGTDPAVPAYSEGELYTLDQAQPGQPTLWAIQTPTGAMQPVHGAARYPAKSVTEKASFQGAEVLVDGPRVIFNNPESLLAVVVFTDGSHAPVIVDKSNAVIVSAVGPGDVNVKPEKAEKTKTSSQPAVTTPTVPPTTIAPPITQPVTQQASCAATSEKPYAPQISSVVPSDESALVVWTYHLLAEQDCLPRTWSVTVTALGGAPQPARPTQVVNGQQQLLFSGLRPGTNYQAIVTAYINNKATQSEPTDFTTTAHGPGAPASVTTRTDGQGGWLVSWSPCTGPNCFVPATSWTVIGSSCGTVFVGQPPVFHLPVSRTSVVVNGGDSMGLLGTSLSFSVQGVGSTGLVGAPTSDHACTQAWQPPDPAAMQLLAAGTPVGQTITAGLEVVATGGPVLAFGGDNVTFTYSVGGHVVGPTAGTRVSVPGLTAAKSYVPTVVVTPVGHPSAAVTVTGHPFSKTLPWPVGLKADASGSVGTNPNTGNVTVTFPNLPAGTFRGAGVLTCASEVLPLNNALSGPQLSTSINLDEMGGRCSVSLTLEDTIVPDPYGIPSPTLSAAFSVGTPQSYDFSVTAGPRCSRHCQELDYKVNYDGPGQPAGTDWRISARASGQRACNLTLPSSPIADFPTALAWPVSCAAPTVLVSWVYLGEPGSASASAPAVVPPTTSSTTTTTAKTTRTTKTTTTTRPTKTTNVASTTSTTRATRATTTTGTTKTTRTVRSTTTTTACPGGNGHAGACSPTTSAPAPTTSTTTNIPPTTTTTPTAPTTAVLPTTTALPPPTTTTIPPTTTSAPGASTTTTTTIPTTTTTTAPTTTLPTLPPPTTTTTVSVTTTTGSVTTTTVSVTTTTGSVTTTTAPTNSTTSTAPPAGGALALGQFPRSGGQGPPEGPRTAWPAGALWVALGAMAGAVCAGSLAWGLSRRPRARLRAYGATEVTT